MSLKLNLNPDLAARLMAEADRQDCTPDQYAQQLLEDHVPKTSQQDRAVALLQSWIDDDDADEQAGTLDYLIHALDADRLSDRALFPPELEGKSW
jgi:hypothetical protein